MEEKKKTMVVRIGFTVTGTMDVEEVRKRILDDLNEAEYSVSNGNMMDYTIDWFEKL